MERPDALLDRRASGLAADRVEIGRVDHARGRSFASGVGGDSHAVLAAVLRRTKAAGPGAAAAVVREAVANALSGRRPRW